MKGAEARVRRHLRPHQRPTWHLDYLLPQGEAEAAIIGHTTGSLECPLAEYLGRSFQVFPGFGSSDCRCPGHLFQSIHLRTMAETATAALHLMGCQPKILASSPELAGWAGSD